MFWVQYQANFHVLGVIPSHIHVLGAIPRQVGANVGAICIPFSVPTELHLQYDRSMLNGMQISPSLAPSLS